MPKALASSLQPIFINTRKYNPYANESFPPRWDLPVITALLITHAVEDEISSQLAKVATRITEVAYRLIVLSKFAIELLAYAVFASYINENRDALTSIFKYLAHKVWDWRLHTIWHPLFEMLRTTNHTPSEKMKGDMKSCSERLEELEKMVHELKPKNDELSQEELEELQKLDEELGGRKPHFHPFAMFVMAKAQVEMGGLLKIENNDPGKTLKAFGKKVQRYAHDNIDGLGINCTCGVSGCTAISFDDCLIGFTSGWHSGMQEITDLEMDFRDACIADALYEVIDGC